MGTPQDPRARHRQKKRRAAKEVRLLVKKAQQAAQPSADKQG